MQNKKTERFLVKLGVGAVFSLMLGLMYKQGEAVSDSIDEKYERDHNVPKDNKKPW